MPPIISVENLSKKYKISHLANRPRYKSLREVITEGASNLVRFRRRSRARLDSPKTEDFWALKGIHFEVQQGEVVGIIGRNGAGKSTLLKVLSRITEPTTGRIRLRGRVASLLEVGTGFHPELTGRENIFLNGAILGMSKVEIRSKFDEIVAFAGVEKFLDTPVKHYSSGMYVRLAFAVAAHLEPEILIVDEVLAVGDAAFQTKCLGKMQDVSSKDGRTVVFVSHNLGAVRHLCSTAILMESGTLMMKGPVNTVADRYLQTILVPRTTPFRTYGTGYTDIRLVTLDGATVTSLSSEQTIFVQVGVRVTKGSDVRCGFTIFNQLDTPIVLCASEHGSVDLEEGEHTFRVRLPAELLPPGTYRIEGAVWDAEHVYHQNDYLCHFQLLSASTRELHGRRSSAQFVFREPWIALSREERLFAKHQYATQ